MLEGLVAWVLNNYLGKYVENLNTDQLSVALLSGKVELENLPLKKDALRHLGLPVEVKTGFIGKVQLQVPVRQIRSAPWIIVIEKLYVVAAPVNLDEWDASVEANIAHERKVALLDGLEAAWRAGHEAADAGYYAASYSSWLSYGTGLLANIVENLQLKINDVHIRYEDALTCGTAFACGLTAESLAAESCDSLWQRGFTLLQGSECSYKLLELQQLAVYWDPVQPPADLLAACTLAELTVRMSSTWLSSHRYLLRPASAVARVRRSRCAGPLRARTRPRVHASLVLDEVELHLAQRQYSEMMGCALGLERIARLRETRALRPAAAVRAAPRDWWLYALRAHCPHHRWMDPKPTWESCLERSRQARQYVATCLQLLSQPAAALPPDRKAAKDEFEWSTPLHILKPLREIAMRKVPIATPASTPEKPPASSGRSLLVRSFPQWWGWYGGADTPGSVRSEGSMHSAGSNPSLSAPQELEEEILDVIADSLDNNTLLKRDAVFGQFEFTLNKGSLVLTMDNEVKVESPPAPPSGGSTPGGGSMELSFRRLVAEVELRPRTNSHALRLRLGSVCLRDRLQAHTLFPYIVAPQGMIRSGLSAMGGAAASAPWWGTPAEPPADAVEPLFQLDYEKRPFGLNCDHKLYVKSASLEVVYNPVAARWLRQFGSLAPLAAVRDSTARRLRDQLSHMMAPHEGSRKSWQIELDISAPQILVAERLWDRDAAVLVVDLGRMRLANDQLDALPAQGQRAATPSDDDEERYMTPCSTPPGSLLSPASPPSPRDQQLHPATLHRRLYDRYNIEFSDLQVLVGRARDNWKYAHTKATSSLHLLNRFSISLQAERRIVRTADPLYPTATLRGTLPALVAHLSEHKLCAVRSVAAVVLPNPVSEEKPETVFEEDDDTSESSATEGTEPSTQQNSKLFMLQFAVDQLSLEVQSRGRSIAEVQVCGVKLGLTARPADLSLSLSVHSLLLVDALQTYGPDCELLVASHKHVGMDCASGSIRGSEPCSPTSPTSPASPTVPPYPSLSPEHTLQAAISSLHANQNYSYNPHFEYDRTSPAPSGHTTNPSFTTWAPGPWAPGTAPGWGAPGAGPGWGAPGVVDEEALIAIELCFVKGEGDSEDLRIANILFNNLDIIANQETIVELIGFVQRVSGPTAGAATSPAQPAAAPSAPPSAPSPPLPPSPPAHSAMPEQVMKETRTEITFDFHRLGVLLLRAGVEDGAAVARKVATATLQEAKIQATIASSHISVGGSLGGVQVVSLCAGTGLHSRVMSVGLGGPPAHPPAVPPALCREMSAAEDKALLFNVTRNAEEGEDGIVNKVVVEVHVASVWYAHCGALLRELSYCVSEFSRYLHELGRSLRAAASQAARDAARSLRPRGEGLYSNPKLSMSMERVSPRRRTLSGAASLDDAPDTDNVELSISVELESPVVIIPVCASSGRVLLAHLGRMALTSRPPQPTPAHTSRPPKARVRCTVKGIALATMDVTEKLKQHLVTSESMQCIYDSGRDAPQPLLHHTALQLTLDHDDTLPQWEVTGKIVGGLHVSASKQQYELVLAALRGLSEPPPPPDDVVDSHTHQMTSSVSEVAVPTLKLDPAVRAQVFRSRGAPAPPPPAPPPNVKVRFQLPSLTIELRGEGGEGGEEGGGGERSLVQLACREFTLQLDRHARDTDVQMSLHSITMEDLTQDPDSKHRMLMVSHTPQVPKAVFVSKSCPNFVTEYPMDDLASVSSLQHHKAFWTSLPSELNVERGERVKDKKGAPTPPCSPECGVPAEAMAEEMTDLSGDDNLVWISVHVRDPQHPEFETKFKKVSRLTKVEFNCLKLVVSPDSWATVLDFFGIAGDQPAPPAPPPHEHEPAPPPPEEGITQTEMSIRSLGVVLVSAGGPGGGGGALCRARVLRLSVRVSSDAIRGEKAVQGTLGALQLADLTPSGSKWVDRLSTHGDHALTFDYQRLSPSQAAAAGHDTSLNLDMGPLTYVHTARFVTALRAALHDCARPRRALLEARKKVSVSAESSAAERRRLSLRVRKPVLVLPVSGRNHHALVAELRALNVTNTFVTEEINGQSELIERKEISVENAWLWCGRGEGGGGGRVARRGGALLQAPTTMKLEVATPTSDRHLVPDLSITGALSTLELTLDPKQYQLIRGVLAHNLGDPDAASVPDQPPVPPPPAQEPAEVWVTTSLRLDLQDVAVRLEPQRDVTSLAKINFIKSRLLLESSSDGGQDVDLVSQEILITDTRYSSEPANRRGNVFSHIVQPLPEGGGGGGGAVQAEVHARKRRDSAAYTIIINKMRLMAVLDWWEAAGQFLLQPPPPAHPRAPGTYQEETFGPAPTNQQPQPNLELKLNITDSQLVLLEDASVWDTNAVILKSTTVIQYRAAHAAHAACPLTCDLSELEVFSCVLGLEDDTALAIVDPARLSLALSAERQLQVSLGTLSLRLSYHDMRMFAAMLHSLPVQARAALQGKESSPEARAPANSHHMGEGGAGGAGGAKGAGGRLPLVIPRRDEALWMLRRKAPQPPPRQETSALWPLKSVEVRADCVTLCVIDDCLDSDVPLLDVTLTDLQVEQDLRKVEEAFEDPLLVQTPAGGVAPTVGSDGGRSGRPGPAGGRLSASLTVDYYNRALSGWEPVIEPWRFTTSWEYTLTDSLSLARLQLEVWSRHVLDANVTSSLIDLARLVRDNWTQDYYAPQCVPGAEASPKGSPAGHRRRAPFVPYALRNHTGHRLWFTALAPATEDFSSPQGAFPDDSWSAVRGGETEPFSFGARRRSPRAPRAAPLPRLALRLDGWAPAAPVAVDKVGVFFRTTTHEKSGLTARLVVEVSLEGSARKLVTVRSALQVVNRLPGPVEIRIEHAPPSVPWSSSGSGRGQCWAVAPGASWACPLGAAAAAAAPSARPLALPAYVPPARPLHWAAVTGDKPELQHYECRAPPDHIYRFSCVVVRERFPMERGPPLAGHTLYLVPALRVESLLPLELQFRVGSAAPARLKPQEVAPLHQVNVEEGVEISVKLEGYTWSTPLSVGGAMSGAGGTGGSFSARLKLKDERSRRLYLNAKVAVKRTDGIKVTISASYWLVNRLGLPIVFRAGSGGGGAGGGGEAAGQGAEHELARHLQPLPFSFADADAAPTLSARLGRAHAGTPEWCSPFGLGPGVTVKKLVVRGGEGGGGDRVYCAAVRVRTGRGRYRHTNIVTLTPRYHIHNNTRATLQFAQHCTATTLSDPAASACHVTAVPGCQLPWHWARWERPHLLCCRELGADGAPRTAWSGAARVDEPRALHLACRLLEGGSSGAGGAGTRAGGGYSGYSVFRAEVALQHGTLLLLLADGERAPPPLRLDNYSPVAIMFHQVGCSEEGVVGAGSSLRYTPPEPEGAAALALRAPGGPRATLQLDALHQPATLTYQNFIYVAFVGSEGALDRPPAAGKQSAGAADDNVLVLEVPIGTTKVILGKKRYGDRSQLWRKGPNSQLVHEGSSPPLCSDAAQQSELTLPPNAMVLDIEGPAPRPGQATALALRRADARRASTQAWRVTAAGRCACAHANLCLQPQGGLFDLRPGARVVLGLEAGGSARAQAVRWQTLRPGSGRLSLELVADGPTRVLRITDSAQPQNVQAPWLAEEPGAIARREWGCRVSLAGLGVSLVGAAPAQELLRALLVGVRLGLCATRHATQLELLVADMQWDNQLLGSPSPVLLYCPRVRGEGVGGVGGAGEGGALHAALELQHRAPRRYNAVYFSHLVLTLRPLAVRLEERLILKLLLWAGVGGAEDEAGGAGDDDETHRVLDHLTAANATRYYFGLIRVMPSQIRLSMITANKLEAELGALKRRLGLTLIRFEDAAVELEPFQRAHTFEPVRATADHMLKHFRDELKWQAAKILGSVDFLGNPLGFVADVSEGVSGLIYEGSVRALLTNVTHGISNSAAKVTESLGDGLERVVVDEAHEETRRRIRSAGAGSHLVAGLRGLGLGVLGGMTSLVKHSYEGAAAEGLGGFLAGVGKGLVGTVTKPAIGVLDLAAEVASALRDTSRRSDKWVPERARAPRCAGGGAGGGGLLPRYCPLAAAGAHFLHQLAPTEDFLAYQVVRAAPHDIRALLSTRHLRIFTCKHHQPQVVMETHLSNLVSCQAVAADGAHYVELGVRGGGGGGAGAGGGAGGAEGVRRPRVQCDSAELAAQLARHAALARQLYHEDVHTLLPHPDLDLDH